RARVTFTVTHCIMTAKQLRNCLICSASITECRLGIDSCRACVVFYKRICGNNRIPTECLRGDVKCFENGAITSCRKCRYARFSQALKDADSNENEDEECRMREAEAVNEPRDSIDVGEARRIDEIRRATFIDHNTRAIGIRGEEGEHRNAGQALLSGAWSTALQAAQLLDRQSSLGQRRQHPGRRNVEEKDQREALQVNTATCHCALPLLVSVQFLRAARPHQLRVQRNDCYARALSQRPPSGDHPRQPGAVRDH
ncbi:hypothetical protein PMAYCL1PPCAC_16326, partial [Pristionchus mayeri]